MAKTRPPPSEDRGGPHLVTRPDLSPKDPVYGLELSAELVDRLDFNLNVDDVVGVDGEALCPHAFQDSEVVIDDLFHADGRGGGRARFGGKTNELEDGAV